jgi:hypothetical protein
MTPSQPLQSWQKFSNSNYGRNQTPTLPAAPPKVTLRTCIAESSNPILASTMVPPRRTRSQTTIHARDITNAPLLPMVVTPMACNPSPPRVPTRSQNLSPRNLSQYYFCGMDTAHLAIPAAPSQCSHSPNHRKRNGIHGTDERPPSTTTVETRLWQRMRAPFPRHSRYSWRQRPKRKKDHLQQNSL